MSVDPLKVIRRIRTRQIFLAGYNQEVMAQLAQRDERHRLAGRAAAAAGKGMGDGFESYWNELEGVMDEAEVDQAEADVADDDSADLDDAAELDDADSDDADDERE